MENEDICIKMSQFNLKTAQRTYQLATMSKAEFYLFDLHLPKTDKDEHNQTKANANANMDLSDLYELGLL